MSSNFWQMQRQTERFESGLTLTQKVKAYVNTWEARCYKQGVPDEVPAKLAAANRAPSYKAIAMAILKNDLHFRSLGFARDENDLCRSLRAERARAESAQLQMFLGGRAT